MIRAGIVAMAVFCAWASYIGAEALCHETNISGDVRYGSVATSSQTASVKAAEALEEMPIIVEVRLEPLWSNIPLDAEVQHKVADLSREYGIDPTLVLAVIEVESMYKVDAIGDQGRSLGLMQIQGRWHMDRMVRLNAENPLDPIQNVTIGIDILGELLGRGRGTAWALTAYNGGEARANRFREADEISEYATKVFKAREAIRNGLDR